MKVPAEKGTLENTNREGNHDNSYWGEPCGGYRQEENTVLLVMVWCVSMVDTPRQSLILRRRERRREGRNNLTRVRDKSKETGVVYS